MGVTFCTSLTILILFGSHGVLGERIDEKDKLSSIERIHFLVPMNFPS